MPSPKASEPALPEDFLRLASTASQPRRRERYARAGLALIEPGELEPDTQHLLLRQLYRALLDQERPRAALAVAEQMVDLGTMPDLAHHDAARVLSGLGAQEAAIAHQRLAARHCPAGRRSFHLWALATLQQHHGDHDGALHSLRKAQLWAGRDRPLIDAQAALCGIEAGRAVPRLADKLAALQRSTCREGYGQYLLGMIADRMGDGPRAVVHLRAFLARHASADPTQVLTLKRELAEARAVMAKRASD